MEETAVVLMINTIIDGVRAVLAEGPADVLKYFPGLQLQKMHSQIKEKHREDERHVDAHRDHDQLFQLLRECCYLLAIYDPSF